MTEHMNFSMATRKTNQSEYNLIENTTEFQLFNVKKNSFDLSVKRLKKLIVDSTTQARFSSLVTLLDNYISSKIAIAWRSGEPVFVYIVKD